MSNAIETHDLRYRAGRDFEIRDLSLAVPTGSIYGFLGPNGSGKTTTIRLVLGLLRPSRGSISVLNRTIPGESTAALAETGYVPERPHLYPSFTVDEILNMHRAFFTRWDPAKAAQLVETFRLRLNQKIRNMSKGETGKLMMLLALAQRPELLVLDEPTDGLDPVVRRDVLMALLEFVSEHGATVFISSHLVHELERICDWVGVMDDGHLVAEMPMQAFKSGIKRLRVENVPAIVAQTPFVILARDTDALGNSEVWTVRGWQDPMTQYFEGSTPSLREVVDLDLEEGFVELLQVARERHPEG